MQNLKAKVIKIKDRPDKIFEKHNQLVDRWKEKNERLKRMESEYEETQVKNRNVNSIKERRKW